MRTQSLLGVGLASLLLLSSCFSLGQQALPEAPERHQFTLGACESITPDAANAGFKVEARQLPLQVLSTAKTPWNTHLRYVYPFTRHTVQFEVEVHNEGTQAIALGERLTLQFENNAPAQQSLPFAFFEKVWPANAVQGPQQLHDHSMALGEVVDRHWHQRQLFPGEHYTGWASFPVEVLSQEPRQLQLTYDTDTEAFVHTLCLTSASAPPSTP